MLLRLTSPDIHDLSLVDCATGDVLYRTSTPVAGPSRSRASSTSSLGWSTRSYWSPSNRSQERLSRAQEKFPEGAHPASRTTAILDPDGEAVGEIMWNGRNVCGIRIGEEVLGGTTELFDAEFVRLLPDETYLPTRMEYTWRLAPESLTLLDDDDEIIGRLYTDCSLLGGRPVPALQPGKGEDYLELAGLRPDEVLEIIITYLLVTTLRDRLYSVTRYVYGPARKRSFANLRLHASRSLANLRDSIRRTVAPSVTQD